MSCKSKNLNVLIIKTQAKENTKNRGQPENHGEQLRNTGNTRGPVNRDRRHRTDMRAKTKGTT